MTQPREPGPDKARWHYQRANEYRELARELLEQSSRASALRAEVLADAAGALLYEAAKQCVNAVANLRGRDPQDNRAKLDEINATIAQGLTPFNLRGGARAAWDLHVHADQGALTPDDFKEQFAYALAFVNEMQDIYRSLATV